jgi:hypothetical protein
MLSWSGTKLKESDPNAAQLGALDIDAVGTGLGTAGLAHGAELIAFADAIAGFDEARLKDARNRLLSAAGPSLMIDAAAVAANFEMMTRVADSTGARFPADQLEQRVGMGVRLGVVMSSGLHGSHAAEG